MRRLTTKICRGAPHVHSRKWIVARVVAEVYQLRCDILRSLSGQSRRRRIALSGCAVTPVAIADGGILRVTCRRGGGGESNGHDRYLQPDVAHDPNLSASRNRRHAGPLPQITDIGRHRFDLRPVETVRHRAHDGRCVRFCRILSAFLTPIHQLLDEIGIELAGQSRNWPAARGRGTVTGRACRDIGVGNAVLKNLLSERDELRRRATDGFWIKSPEIRRQSRDHPRTQGVRHIEHDIVGAAVLDKGAELILQILGLLAGEARNRKISLIALRRRPVTVFAIREFGLDAPRRGRVHVTGAANSDKSDGPKYDWQSNPRAERTGNTALRPVVPTHGIDTLTASNHRFLTRPDRIETAHDITPGN